MSSEILHIPTGIVYKNRKDACKSMGQGNYRRALKNREFEIKDFHPRVK